MLCGTEQLIGSLPEVKWAQQVKSLATELQEESLRVIVQHLPKVTRTQAFQDLRRVRRWWSQFILTQRRFLQNFSVTSDSVTEGRVHPRTHVVEEAVFSHKGRCDCGQLLWSFCCCELSVWRRHGGRHSPWEGRAKTRGGEMKQILFTWPFCVCLFNRCTVTLRLCCCSVFESKTSHLSSQRLLSWALNQGFYVGLVLLSWFLKLLFSCYHVAIIL